MEETWIIRWELKNTKYLVGNEVRLEIANPVDENKGEVGSKDTVKRTSKMYLTMRSIILQTIQRSEIRC